MRAAFKYALFILCMLLQLNLYGEEQSFTTHRQCNDLKGNKLWEAAVTITPLKEKGNDVYLLTEEGKGNYSDYEGFTRRKYELEFISGKGRLVPLYMKKEVYSAEEKILLEETQTFDAEKKQILSEVKDHLKNKKTKAEFKYKEETMTSLLLGLYIRNFLEAGDREKTVNLLSDEPSLYRITLKVVGKEEITVNGVKREAYKICIDPNIGLLSPAKIFIPKNYVWHSARPDYEWLMFKGLESSLNSPLVEMITLDR